MREWVREEIWSLDGADAAEWIRRFEAVCDVDNAEPGLGFEFPPLFLPSHWRTVPVVGWAEESDDRIRWDDEPLGEREWRLIRNRGISDSFARAYWPPLNLHAPLWRMAVENGQSEIAVTGWGRDRTSVVVGPPSGRTVELTTMMPNAGLGATLVECAITDRSGLWAMYSCTEDTSVLGGEPEFVDAFVARCGGLAWVQALYDISVDENDLPNYAFRALYDDVGWSWPFDDNGEPL